MLNLNSDRILNYTVDSGLASNQIKNSREYYVLALLKHLFPDQFSLLHKSESPDLQDSEGFLGVEVTSGIRRRDELISGEGAKFFRAKTIAEKESSLQKIMNVGGNIERFVISTPATTIELDWEQVIEVFQKKLEKIDSYKESLKHVGLAIIIDYPTFPFNDYNWSASLSELNQQKYDFVIFSHWSGIDIYDFYADKFYSKSISCEERELLKKLGRMTAEGIIAEEDSEWQ